MAAEILSPAGGMEQAAAAVRCGADALYLGLKSFSARGSAKNFSQEELREVVSFCHERGVKVYAAVNTVILDDEIAELADTLEVICKTGVDAIITQDLALPYLVKRCCPALELHASTQMTLHTSLGLQLAKRLGFKRTVLSRELPLGGIAKLCREEDMEIEVFVHGALCMSVSGQCLMSAMIGGRSANRGLCAQPCRLPCSVERGAKAEHALSLKDMSYLDSLTELCRVGVDSLKIEGRMKRPEYAAFTAYCAARAMKGEEYDRRLLSELFSRGGFTDGYLRSRTGGEMFGMRTAEDAKTAAAAYPKIHELYRREVKRSQISFFVRIKSGEPLEITAADENGLTAVFSGGVPEAAKRRAVDEEFVRKCLEKLGDTFFEMTDCRCEIDEGLSLPAAAFNEARRELCRRLCALREEHFTRRVDFARSIACEKTQPAAKAPTLRIVAEKALQITDIDSEGVELFFLPLDIPELQKAAKVVSAAKLGVTMPRFTFDEDADMAKLRAAADMGIEHILCTNLSHLEAARVLGLTAHTAQGLNVTNSLAVKALAELGAADIIASQELKAAQIRAISRDVPLGAVVCARPALMLTVNCPIKAHGGCGGCKRQLFDRTGRRFPIKCSKRQGYVEILNCDRLCVFDRLPDFAADFYVIELFDESPDKAAAIVKDFHRRRKPEGTNAGLYFRGLKR